MYAGWVLLVINNSSTHTPRMMVQNHHRPRQPDAVQIPLPRVPLLPITETVHELFMFVRAACRIMESCGTAGSEATSPGSCHKLNIHHLTSCSLLEREQFAMCLVASKQALSCNIMQCLWSKCLSRFHQRRSLQDHYPRRGRLQHPPSPYGHGGQSAPSPVSVPLQSSSKMFHLRFRGLWGDPEGEPSIFICPRL